jgi:inner membrane protein involved in colicin E2 resistance
MNGNYTIPERVASLETGRADDQRAVQLVATNLTEKVDNLKTLVRVIYGILLLVIALAGLFISRGGH